MLRDNRWSFVEQHGCSASFEKRRWLSILVYRVFFFFLLPAFDRNARSNPSKFLQAPVPDMIYLLISNSCPSVPTSLNRNDSMPVSAGVTVPILCLVRSIQRITPCYSACCMKMVERINSRPVYLFGFGHWICSTMIDENWSLNGIKECKWKNAAVADVEKYFNWYFLSIGK